MPIIKSAKKRVRVSTKAAIRNSKTKRSLKGALKAFAKAVTGAGKDARKLESKAHSELDKAAKKGVMHKNKVARKKAQLARAAKVATVAPGKKVAKKPAAAKKTATKKAPTKKTTSKK